MANLDALIMVGIFILSATLFINYRITTLHRQQAKYLYDHWKSIGAVKPPSGDLANPVKKGHSYIPQKDPDYIMSGKVVDNFKSQDDENIDMFD